MYSQKQYNSKFFNKILQIGVDLSMEQSTSYRSHTCGELRMEHAGQRVELAGFLDNVR